MKRLFIAFAAIAMLAGCQSIKNVYDAANSVTISQSTIDKVMAGYDTGFLAAATTYRELYDKNPCHAGQHASTANLCAERSIVVKLQTIDKGVEDALKAAQDQLDACTAAGQSTCSGLGAAYDVLKSTISSAEATAVQLGVMK